MREGIKQLKRPCQVQYIPGVVLLAIVEAIQIFNIRKWKFSLTSFMSFVKEFKTIQLQYNNTLGFFDPPQPQSDQTLTFYFFNIDPAPAS